MSEDRHPDAEQRGRDEGAEQRLVSLIVGMGHQGHACREQLRTGRLDLHAAVGAHQWKAEAVVGARALAVLELRLTDGGPEVDVPQGGGRALDDLASHRQPEEATLGHPLGPLADGGIRVGPVDGESKCPPQVLEHLLVLQGELVAQGHEVGPGDGDRVLVGLCRRHEVRVVREAWVAADPEVVLHPALSRETVVVPAHRVEDLPAAHPVEPGHGVGVGVGEHVADMERTRHGGRRGVDGEHLLAGGGAVEGVDALGLPPGGPGRLQAFQAGLIGDSPA